MRKLTLALDALRVESFATAGARSSGEGTVHGRSMVTNEPTCQSADPAYCTGYGTCYATCQGCGGSSGTCGASCASCDPSCVFSCWPC